jgi:hypothetical protein
MAKFGLKLKRRDQRPFTRNNAAKCSIATAAKRVYGGRAIATDTLVIKRGGRTWTLRVGADGQDVEATHDAGERVGARTITLYGKPPPTLAEQAEAAKRARDARQQARAARKARAQERAAQQARAQAAERPDPRQQARAAVREQPRAAERPRSAEDERAARTRARIQEAEARERLSATQLRARTPREQPVPQPRAAAQPRPAERQGARAQQPREQIRAIEPPRTGLQWLLRNPFARPEPERQPEPAAARRHP